MPGAVTTRAYTSGQAGVFLEVRCAQPFIGG